MPLWVEWFVLVIEDAFDRRDEVEQGRVDAVAVAQELFESGSSSTERASARVTVEPRPIITSMMSSMGLLSRFCRLTA